MRVLIAPRNKPNRYACDGYRSQYPNTSAEALNVFHDILSELVSTESASNPVRQPSCRRVISRREVAIKHIRELEKV
jgi:hypothetical protein